MYECLGYIRKNRHRWNIGKGLHSLWRKSCLIDDFGFSPVKAPKTLERKNLRTGKILHLCFLQIHTHLRISTSPKMASGSGDFANGNTEYVDADQLRHPKKLKDDPELNNFLGKVDEISEVIKALASHDPSENEKGIWKADLLLGDVKRKGSGDGRSFDGDPENVRCEVTKDRSVINKATDPPSEGEMGTQVWMKMMEQDAKERGDRRKESKVKSDEFRKKGNIAFSQKDYTNALKYYNQAIELIKDSPCLYNNRALTYLRLGIFSSAVQDCEKALMLEEFSMRARCFMAKAYFLMGDAEKCRQVLFEAREKLPGSVDLLNDYEADLFKMECEKPFDYDLDSERKWQAAANYEGTQFPVKTKKEKQKQTTSTLKPEPEPKSDESKEDVEDELGGAGDHDESVNDKV